MSSFHPVLGLLAVAVCISFPKGATFTLILNDQSSVEKIHESNLDKLITARKQNNDQARSFNKNSDHARFSDDKDQRDGNVIVGRNAAYSYRTGGFDEVSNLRAAGEIALRREAAAAESASGSMGDESAEQDGLVSSKGSIQDDSRSSDSASSDATEKNSHGNQSGDASLGIAVSSSQEDCEEEEHTGQKDSNEIASDPNNGKEADSVSTPPSTADSNTDPTTSPNASKEECSDSEETDQSKPDDTTSSPSNGEKAKSTSATTPSTAHSNPSQDTIPNTVNQGSEDDCEDSEPTSDGSSSEPTTQTHETQEPESEDCEETEKPNNEVTQATATPTKKQPKEPDNDNLSSGSNGGTDEDFQRFSGSYSDENTDPGTDIRWKR